MLLALELEAFRVVDVGAGLHAEEGVVRHGVGSPAVMAVVGGDERRADGPCDVDEHRVGAMLICKPVILQLDEEVLGTEDVLQPARERLRLALLTGKQGLQHDTAEAARGDDEPGVVAFEQLPVDAGLVVVALEIGGGRELDEVAVALGRLGEDGQVVVELLTSVALAPGVVDPAAPDRPVEPGVGRHVGLGPDDRGDSLLTALLVEVENAVHVAVIGDCERRLAVLARSADDVADPRGTVEHRVLGMGVQVNERACIRPIPGGRAWLHCVTHSLSTGFFHSCGQMTVV